MGKSTESLEQRRKLKEDYNQHLEIEADGRKVRNALGYYYDDNGENFDFTKELTSKKVTCSQCQHEVSQKMLKG
jgi:hypothetical protein